MRTLLELHSHSDEELNQTSITAKVGRRCHAPWPRKFLASSAYACALLRRARPPQPSTLTAHKSYLVSPCWGTNKGALRGYHTAHMSGDKNCRHHISPRGAAQACPCCTELGSHRKTDKGVKIKGKTSLSFEHWDHNWKKNETRKGFY